MLIVEILRLSYKRNNKLIPIPYCLRIYDISGVFHQSHHNLRIILLEVATLSLRQSYYNFILRAGPQ